MKYTINRCIAFSCYAIRYSEIRDSSISVKLVELVHQSIYIWPIWFLAITHTDTLNWNIVIEYTVCLRSMSIFGVCECTWFFFSSFGFAFGCSFCSWCERIFANRLFDLLWLLLLPQFMDRLKFEHRYSQCMRNISARNDDYTNYLRGHVSSKERKSCHSTILYSIQMLSTKLFRSIGRQSWIM